MTDVALHAALTREARFDRTWSNQSISHRIQGVLTTFTAKTRENHGPARLAGGWVDIWRAVTIGRESFKHDSQLQIGIRMKEVLP